MRINARLDDTHARMLDYLKAKTQAGISDVIKRAIELYYARERGAGDEETPFQIAERLGLIGCMEAEPDLSVRYKEYLSESLERKHGHR